MKKRGIVTNFEFWRNLINVWSILFFFVIIHDFFVNNANTEILNVISIVYIGTLAIYVSNKEFERWYNHHERQHPGEIFVIIWSVLVVILIIADFFKQNSYHIPSSVISSYIAVLTILAITRKSKQTYQTHHSHHSKK